ncbi:MAG: hypothetical protein BWY56_02541 [Acidobacteria bacterium ADurb.Bin340]|nr:MAG: hypothetical protein BWY56_02541 [Acidobacteria bacterium ADurb.Bin340]
MLRHAGQLDEVLELEFPPAAPNAGLPKRIGQATGLSLEPLLHIQEVLDLLLKLGLARFASLMKVPHLLVHGAEALFQGLQKLCDGRLAGFEVALGLPLSLGEDLLGHGQEGAAAALQRPGGMGLEGLHHPGPGLLEGRLHPLNACALNLEIRDLVLQVPALSLEGIHLVQLSIELTAQLRFHALMGIESGGQLLAEAFQVGGLRSGGFCELALGIRSRLEGALQLFRPQTQAIPFCQVRGHSGALNQPSKDDSRSCGEDCQDQGGHRHHAALPRRPRTSP